MFIVIPTKGRATRQTTLYNLPPSIQEKTFLCIYPEELSAHATHPGLRMVVSPDVKGIAQKRQWILDETLKSGMNKVVMLDDDLVFALRRSDEPTKFIGATDEDVVAMFKSIEILLDDYAMVGVAGREGANRQTENIILNTRLMRVLGYRADTLKELGIKATVADVMNDFGVVLELLTRGHPVANINWIVQNQHGSDSTGGCSTYRTPEVQTAAAQALHDRFPQFVKIVQKETKTAWGGKPRTDVIIQWKAAYAEGLRRSDLPHFGHGHE